MGPPEEDAGSRAELMLIQGTWCDSCGKGPFEGERNVSWRVAWHGNGVWKLAGRALTGPVAY